MRVLPCADVLDLSVTASLSLSQRWRNRSESMTDPLCPPRCGDVPSAFLNNGAGTEASMKLPAQPDARAMVQNAMRDVADAPVGELAVIRDLEIPGPAGTISPARLYDKRDNRGCGSGDGVLSTAAGSSSAISTLTSLIAPKSRDCSWTCRSYRSTIGLGPECIPTPPPSHKIAKLRPPAGSRPVPTSYGPCMSLASSLSGDSAGGNLTIVDQHGIAR